MRRLLKYGVIALLLFTGCAERSREPVGAAPTAPATVAQAAPRSSSAPEAPVKPGETHAREVWESPRGCEAALRRGARLPRATDVVRVGTWNVRWFPDGKPGKRPADGTDVPWLACAVTWLDLDALAVQEFKATASARARVDELLAILKKGTGASWKLRLDDCSNAAGQHVGVLWRTDRLNAGKIQVVSELNPHGQACKDQLRPGLAVYLAHPGGIDFTLVSLHAKSGTKRRDYSLRQRVAGRIRSLWSQLAAESGDLDVVLAGDFNTMGCRGCSPSVTPGDEIAALDRAVSPLGRRVVARPACTHAYRRSAGNLDHLVVRLDPAELAPTTMARATGYCASNSCRFDGPRPAARQRLSDHCPVVLDLNNADVDQAATAPKKP